jgi:predicted MFS family arabinose efflux permease
MKHPRSGLSQHPDFLKLWFGQTISEFGSHITRDGLPLTAVILLSATPEQMGVLTAISSLPVLLFGLFVGLWVDRLRRRPLMIAADIGRMLLLLCVPAFALAGALNVEFLYVIAAATSLLTLTFEVAYRSLLPSLVERNDLVEGNSKLATTSALAEIGGPALAGLLIQWISAPLAIFFDALSFLFSAVSAALIRTPEPPPQPPAEAASFRHEIAQGFAVIAGEPVLRALAVGAALRAFFGSFIGTLYGLYAIRVLGLSVGTLGFLIAAGGIGALVGALLAARLPRRYGLGTTLTGALLISGIINLLIPAAGGSALLAALLLVIAQLIGDAAMMIYEVNEISLRQMLVPRHLLGRANASIGFLTQGIAPVGALIAGLVAGSVGERTTLWIAVLGILFTAAWTRLSAVRRAHLTFASEPTS